MIYKSVKYVVFGLIGALALLAFYFLILSFANSFSHALEEFRRIWYWVLALAAGFGIQIGLYFYLRDLIRGKDKAATAATAANAGLSTVSMIACCAHHLVDVLPILGLSAAALFLIQYQTYFMALGVGSNIIGIYYMIRIIRKHKIFSNY